MNRFVLSTTAEYFEVFDTKNKETVYVSLNRNLCIEKRRQFEEKHDGRIV